MKRYKFFRDELSEGCFCSVDESERGIYVDFSDVRPLLALARAVIHQHVNVSKTEGLTLARGQLTGLADLAKATLLKLGECV